MPGFQTCNAEIFNKPQRTGGGGRPGALGPTPKSALVKLNHLSAGEHHVVRTGKKHTQAKRAISVNLGKQDKTSQQMYVMF